jgi:cytochrome P450
MFVSLLMADESIAALVRRSCEVWDDAVRQWASPGPFELIPQGGGDPGTGHRCPGEQIVVAVLAALAQRLARLHCHLPAQDLGISLRRIPALPASRVVLEVRGG